MGEKHDSDDAMPEDWPVNKAWRSKGKEKEDREALKKEREELKKKETNKLLFGGGKKHYGFTNSGESNEAVKETREGIKRKEANEAMYARDRGYKEHR